MGAGKRIGATNFRFYILLLAYTDLIGSLFRLCVDNRPVQKAMFDYKILCVATATFIHGLNVFEATNLALVGIERFISVRWPREYLGLFFTRHFPKFLIGSLAGWWTIYIIVAILFHDKAYSSKGSGGCTLGSKLVPKLGLLSSGAVAICLLLIIIFYFLLLERALKVMKRVRQARTNTEYRQIRQITISVNAIVLSKIVCWLPLLIAIVLRNTRYYHFAIDYVGRVFICIYCLLSPILYGSTSTRYRRYVKRRFVTSENNTDPLATSANDGTASTSRGANNQNNNSRNKVGVINPSIEIDKLGQQASSSTEVCQHK